MAVNNKTIWMCWFQGWNNATDQSKLCKESWAFHNPEWDIVYLDNTNISKYVDVSNILPDNQKAKYPAAYSDVLRIALLKEHGGV